MSGGHTPGPWQSRRFHGETWPDNRWSVGQAANNGYCVCVCPRYADPDNMADAHLIAAAPDFADNAPRAIEMLRVAAAFIREHDPDGIAHYDEAVCDGYCIADDCESAAETLQGVLTKAKGGDA